MSHLGAIARGITLVALWLVVTFIGPGMAGAWDEPTLAKGYVSKNSAINGVILFLHGCDGGSNTSPFVDWYDWFERSGFRYMRQTVLRSRGLQCRALPLIQTRMKYMHFESSRP